MTTELKISMQTFAALVFIWVVLLVPSQAWFKSNTEHFDNLYSMRERYERWLESNGRKYSSRDEWLMRFGIYQSNVLLVDYINSQNLSFKLTDNKFADMTNDEFKSMYMGFSPQNLLKERHHNATDHQLQELPTSANDEKSLQAAVANQPVSVAVDAGGYLFQLYSHGVFSGYCGTHLNHGVTVVGYGDDNGKKYWTVKNSWGTGWGESGYIRMQRDFIRKKGICGIAMDASYPTKD